MTFDTVGIIGKHGDLQVAEIVLDLARHLAAAGRSVLIDATTNAAFDNGLRQAEARIEPIERIGASADLCIIVGGDGTFLGAARALGGCDVPLLGVNLGHLGFLTDISPDERLTHLDAVLAGEYVAERRFLLQVQVSRDGQPQRTALALNEAVIHKLNVARLLSIETSIDDKLVNGMRSDGLIVATPTGSTAYALSGGGPIVYPTLDAMLLVPVAAHTLSARPIVIAGSSEVVVRLRGGSASAAQLTCDGQNIVELGDADTVTIRRHEPGLTLVHPRDYDYFATLRAKLHWAREL